MFRGHPAWRSGFMISRTATTALIVIVLSALSILAGQHGLLSSASSILASVGFLGLGVLMVWRMRASRLYVISGRGVSVEAGFPIRTSQTEMSFRKIQMVDVRQNILEKLILKTGDVIVDSGADDHWQSELVLAGVKNPRGVANLIREGEDVSMQPQWNPTGFGERPSWERPAAPPASPWDRPGSAPANPWDRPSGSDDPYGGGRPPLPPTDGLY